MQKIKNRLAGAVLLTAILLSLLAGFHCGYDHTAPYTAPSDRYPRLAMWWPNSWEQSLDDLKRYNWIGWGSWDNPETLAELKTLNPNQNHFISLSLTETSMRNYQNNYSVMGKIPTEWFLTQRGSYLAHSLNATETSVHVEAVVDEHGAPLFAVNDVISCEFESMKIVGIDAGARTLLVERGFYRPAAAHETGVRIAAQITFWPGSWVMNMSTMCPNVDINDGNGPQQWVDYASRHLLPEEGWDGYIVDRVEATQGWLAGHCARTIDPNCSNEVVSDDYAAFDDAWYNGIAGFFQRLRALYGGKPIIGNNAGAYCDLLNGSIYESFPGNWDNTPSTYERWASRALGDYGYIRVSQSGYAPNYSLAETYEDEEGPDPGGDLTYINPFEQPGFVPNYQKMRYGLTTALLGDGYFSYEINTNGHGSLGLMWFDEYDNAGRERGYLGIPKGEAFIVKEAGDGAVWKRHYEHGIVICNPTTVVVTVELGGTFRLIDGSQVPEINSGELVEEITLQSRDGRILLRE